MVHLLIISLNNDPSARLGTDHAGGQTKYVLELTKNLLFEGCGIEIITIGYDGQKEKEEFVPGAIIKRFFRDNGKPYGYDLSPEEMTTLASKVCNYVDTSTQKFDALLCCYWVSGKAAIQVSKSISCPLVVTFCQLAAFKQTVDASEAVNERFQQEKILGMHATAIIATNLAEKHALENLYGIDPKKIHLIPRGIDLKVFYP